MASTTGACGILFAVFCIILQNQGSFGSNARIEILPSQEHQTKAIGKNVLLTCTAEAEDSRLLGELKWLDPNGRVIEKQRPNSRIYTEQMPKSLALMIPILDQSDAGQYTCTTTYANSEVISKNIIIDPIYAISWTDAPEEQYPILHQDYKIRCAVSASPAPQVDWLHNNEMIKNSQRFIIENDGLKIKKPVESDDGIYICRAIVASTGELAERVIRVEVHTPPEIEGMDTNPIVTEGTIVDIPCKARGKPQPTFSWIKMSNMKNLSMADRFSVNQLTGMLTINTVRPEDEGEYKCVASNKANTVDKKIFLTVLIKPKIVEFHNLSVPIGSEVKMQCRATGNPQPNITFRKLSNTRSYTIGTQPTETRIRVSPTQKKSDNEVFADLTIGPLNRFDDGLYECIAENTGGRDVKNGHLTVQFPPSFDKMIDRIEDSWSWARNPVNLSCMAESIPNATITWTLNGRLIEGDRNVHKFGNGPQSTITVNPVSRDYYGFYKCTATNLLGTAAFQINLREATPPESITQFQPKVVTATTITFNLFGPVPGSNGGRPVIAYDVQYKKQFESWQDNPKTKRWPIDSPYILENLEPEARYTFQFAAVNDVGRGPWTSSYDHLMPKKSAPEQPRIISSNYIDGYVPSPYTDRVEVRWNIPADNGDPIIRYTIKYCPVKRSITGLWENIGRSCTTVELRSHDHASKELTQLTSDTYYRIELVAFNSIGGSVPGEIIMKTARGPDMDVTVAENVALLSSGVIIGIVVASLFLMLVVVDLCCFCANNAGLLFLLCEMRRGKPKNEDDPKLRREQKEPLDDHTSKIINYETRPMLDEKTKLDTVVNYDLKNGAQTTPFIGKDSAV